MSRIPEHIVQQVEDAGKVIVTPKPLLLSKEVWWNVVIVAVQLTGLLPEPFGPIVGPLVQGIGTILIRKYFTEAPIK